MATPELKLVHELSGQILRTPEEWRQLLVRGGFALGLERRNALTNHVCMLFEPD